MVYSRTASFWELKLAAGWLKQNRAQKRHEKTDKQFYLWILKVFGERERTNERASERGELAKRKTAENI